MEGVTRTVRSVDVSANDVDKVANGIEELYDDSLDVIVIRRALPVAPLAAAAEQVDRDDLEKGWARPNQKMPTEDIQLLGTDTPATPTYRDPRGASLDAYLNSAVRHRDAAGAIFDHAFNPLTEVQHALSRMSGGRPVEVARASDGREYVALTVRRLGDGKQIGIHHDYHYPLPMYSELAPRLDTRTLVSFVVTLQRPSQGGDLLVYGVTPTTPDAPKAPNGFSWDLAAIEQRYDSARFTTEAGDLFLLASGRCLHRVDSIAGPRARVTMGGFLALDKARRSVVFWS